MSVVHHDLCFGCGTTNLFGLQMEIDPGDEGVSGRFFLKQDHQGARSGAHEGVVAAALEEAMALAVHAEGIEGRASRLDVRFESQAPIGTFVQVGGRIDSRADDSLEASATASSDDGKPLASASATFVLDGLDSV